MSLLCFEICLHVQKKVMTCQVTEHCICDNPNFVRKSIYVYTYTCIVTHTSLGS